MSTKVCCHCHQPIACVRWEASISSKTVYDGKTWIVHEHMRCAVEADKVGMANREPKEMR